jgi:hypothetical protein
VFAFASAIEPTSPPHAASPGVENRRSHQPVKAVFGEPHRRRRQQHIEARRDSHLNLADAAIHFNPTQGPMYRRRPTIEYGRTRKSSYWLSAEIFNLVLIRVRLYRSVILRCSADATVIKARPKHEGPCFQKNGRVDPARVDRRGGGGRGAQILWRERENDPPPDHRLGCSAFCKRSARIASL